MKNVKLTLTGVALGALLAALTMNGFFNEATQVKQAKTAWCAESCSKADFANAVSANFK